MQQPVAMETSSIELDKLLNSAADWLVSPTVSKTSGDCTNECTGVCHMLPSCELNAGTQSSLNAHADLFDQFQPLDIGDLVDFDEAAVGAPSDKCGAYVTAAASSSTTSTSMPSSLTAVSGQCGSVQEFSTTCADGYSAASNWLGISTAATSSSSTTITTTAFSSDESSSDSGLELSPVSSVGTECVDTPSAAMLSPNDTEQQQQQSQQQQQQLTSQSDSAVGGAVIVSSVPYRGARRNTVQRRLPVVRLSKHVRSVVASVSPPQPPPNTPPHATSIGTPLLELAVWPSGDTTNTTPPNIAPAPPSPSPTHLRPIAVRPSQALAVSLPNAATRDINTHTTGMSTEAQMRELKRRELLLKNRLSATQSRQRQLRRLEQLQQQLLTATADNRQLRARCQQLEAEVQQLRARLSAGSCQLIQPVSESAAKPASNSTSRISRAVLLTLVVMVCINIPALHNVLQSSTESVSSSSYSARSAASFARRSRRVGGRTLLWLADNSTTSGGDQRRPPSSSWPSVSVPVADAVERIRRHVPLPTPANLTDEAIDCSQYKSAEGGVNGSEVRRLERDMRGAFFYASPASAAAASQDWPSRIDALSELTAPAATQKRPRQRRPRQRQWLRRAVQQLRSRRPGNFLVVAAPGDNVLLLPPPTPPHGSNVDVRHDAAAARRRYGNSTDDAGWRPQLSLLLPVASLTHRPTVTEGELWSMLEIHCQVVDTRRVVTPPHSSTSYTTSTSRNNNNIKQHNITTTQV